MRFCKGSGTALCIAALSCFPTANAVAKDLGKRSLLQRPSNLLLADSANVTSLGDSHPHFSAEIYSGHVRLRSISMLMNTVEALATLALRDQTARGPCAHFQAHGYDDVVVDVVPLQPATDVLNEVAVLCISDGMYSLIRDQTYKNAKIVCLWDAVPVAQVYFDTSRYHLSSSNITEALLSSTADTLGGSDSNNFSSLTTTITNNVTLLEAVTPVFFFSPDSQILTIPGVFITLILALKECAFRPNTDTVPTYTVIQAVEEGDASMVFEPYQIRTRPPFFEYRWLIETLRQLPGFLIQQSRFAELSIGIVVDGVHVGNGVVEKAKPDGLAEKADEAMVRKGQWVSRRKSSCC